MALGVKEKVRVVSVQACCHVKCWPTGPFIQILLYYNTDQNPGIMQGGKTWAIVSEGLLFWLGQNITVKGV